MNHTAQKELKKAIPHRSTTVEERFYHQRFNTPRVSGDGKREISHVTAFARPDKEGNWAVSYAECDHRDQFSRRQGRSIARRKYFQGKKFRLDSPTYDDVLKPYIDSAL